jgi:excisionase family DNA binding protein
MASFITPQIRNNATMNSESHDPELKMINAGELAQILAVSRRTVWRMLSGGNLPQPIRIGGAVRWKLYEIRRWIEQGCPVVHDRE